jgi:hypothetical protein
MLSSKKTARLSSSRELSAGLLVAVFELTQREAAEARAQQHDGRGFRNRGSTTATVAATA